MACAAAPTKGIANAARVSRGSKYDVWSGLSVEDPERNASEHVTVTVVIYNTITDGVPSEDDVAAAIDDLEALYAACGAEGRLSDSHFDFMKKADYDVAEGLTTQRLRCRCCHRRSGGDLRDFKVVGGECSYEFRRWVV